MLYSKATLFPVNALFQVISKVVEGFKLSPPFGVFKINTGNAANMVKLASL